LHKEVEIMSIPTARWALVFSLALLTGGCAWQNSDTVERLDALVTTSRFEARLGRLETSLAARCEALDGAQADQRQALTGLRRAVQGVGRRVSRLNDDVTRLTRDTVVEVPECPAPRSPELADKEVLGRSEWIGLPTIGTFLKARIDTGANTGSLSAREITEFERDGEDWVRFKLALDDEAVVADAARDTWIEARITRRVRIIQAAGEESRPVISLPLALGPIEQNVDFTLNDRSHLTYPVLLGRRFLMDIAVVDVAREYLHERPEYPSEPPADAT